MIMKTTNCSGLINLILNAYFEILSVIIIITFEIVFKPTLIKMKYHHNYCN